MSGQRGSEKLLAAWKARALTEESVREIADALEQSPAKVESASFLGGAGASGLQLVLSYDGDDTPWCGNDILFWMKWHRKYGGGTITGPVILINGKPFPEFARVQLNFGHVGPENPDLSEQFGLGVEG